MRYILFSYFVVGVSFHERYLIRSISWKITNDSDQKIQHACWMEPVPGKVVQIKSGLLSNLASALYFYKKIEKIDQKK